MPLQSGTSAVWSLIGGLLLFILALAAVWFCLRWLGRHYNNGMGNQGGSIRVLERANLAPDRSLVIVRTKNQVWLLGLSPQHIDVIGQLDAAEYPEPETPAGTPAKPFSAALQQALQGFGGMRRRGSENSESKDG